MPPRKKTESLPAELKTADYRHSAEKRTNIPPARIAGEGTVPQVPKARYSYSPHLTPTLQFDTTGESDKLVELAEAATKRQLTKEEAARLTAGLRVLDPALEWAGKREQREKGPLEVDPVALHIHERVSARAIVRAALREDVQRDLFADPQQPYQQAVQFYRHDVDWANRLILGDSLQVMSSLTQREGLAGKVQMIYMDPPYGIKFASNFQSEVGKPSVKEKDDDFTREAEMVKAYRDTWTLGVHSYLSYLRDRLVVARELLAKSGSIFVQISDENLHRVRCLLDEVFGPENFQALIAYRTSVPLRSTGLASTGDFLLWYSKDSKSMKRYDLFLPREVGAGGIYTNVEESSGLRRTMSDDEKDGAFIPDKAKVFGTDNLVSSGYTPTCIYSVEFEGATYTPSSGKSWKTNKEGMRRLIAARRVNASGKTLRAMMYVDDYPVYKLTTVWTDTKGESEKDYVVQTATKVVQRCMLMTTDPGDLVLDPTCGSGTTAAVAEQWGRRWITIDTSRVAVSIARQRLLTTRYELFRARDPKSSETLAQGTDPARGFVYKTVPHVTLKSIAQNEVLDKIAKHQPELSLRLAVLNEALQSVSTDLRSRLKDKLAQKLRTQGKRSITDADRRRWVLPSEPWSEWSVPFDTDEDWPSHLSAALTSYRKTWRAKMDELDEAIAANAEQEELVDQPEVVRGVVRVSGPFTVEGVRPEELNLSEDGLFDGTPNEFEPEESSLAAAAQQQNLHAYLSRMIQLIRQDGLTFINNQRRNFSQVEPLFDTGTGATLHAEGVWSTEPPESLDVAIGFGPQYGPVTALQVEELIRASKRHSELVVAGFSFDADATSIIQQYSTKKLRIHQAYIRPDVNPGMDGLLKDTPNSQLFTVFGTPEIEVREDANGDWLVELKGVDIYDPVANTVRSTGADKVAAWFLDSDFDGRCFAITQAFFPNQDAWEKLAKALGSSADSNAFEALGGTVSIPFGPGSYKRIAVKVIDPRGNEVMAVRALEG